MHQFQRSRQLAALRLEYKMTKTQKQLQSEQTADHIIEAASRLFARNGFHGTSIADLVAQTGLTRGAFYHRFQSREALFFAVVQSAKER